MYRSTDPTSAAPRRSSVQGRLRPTSARTASLAFSEDAIPPRSDEGVIIENRPPRCARFPRRAARVVIGTDAWFYSSSSSSDSRDSLGAEARSRARAFLDEACHADVAIVLSRPQSPPSQQDTPRDDSTIDGASDRRSSVDSRAYDDENDDNDDDDIGEEDQARYQADRQAWLRSRQLQGFRPRLEWQAHTNYITALRLIDNPEALVSCSQDGSARIWSKRGAPNGVLMCTPPPMLKIETAGVPKDHSEAAAGEQEDTADKSSPVELNLDKSECPWRFLVDGEARRRPKVQRAESMMLRLFPRHNPLLRSAFAVRMLGVLGNAAEGELQSSKAEVAADTRARQLAQQRRMSVLQQIARSDEGSRAAFNVSDGMTTGGLDAPSALLVHEEALIDAAAILLDSQDVSVSRSVAARADARRRSVQALGRLRHGSQTSPGLPATALPPIGAQVSTTDLLKEIEEDIRKAEEADAEHRLPPRLAAKILLGADSAVSATLTRDQLAATDASVVTLPLPPRMVAMYPNFVRRASDLAASKSSRQSTSEALPTSRPTSAKATCDPTISVTMRRPLSATSRPLPRTTARAWPARPRQAAVDDHDDDADSFVIRDVREDDDDDAAADRELEARLARAEAEAQARDQSRPTSAAAFRAKINERVRESRRNRPQSAVLPTIRPPAIPRPPMRETGHQSHRSSVGHSRPSSARDRALAWASSSLRPSAMRDGLPPQFGSATREQVRDVVRMFLQVDSDGSGSVSVDEFLNAPFIAASDMSQFTRSLFCSLDKDRSGTITLEELLGAAFPGLFREQFQQLCRFARRYSVEQHSARTRIQNAAENLLEPIATTRDSP